MYAIVLILLTSLILLYYLTTRKPHKFPPGPQWLPVFGSVHALRRASRKCGLPIGLQKLANEYKTQVLGLKLMNSYTVAIFGYEAVKTALMQSEFSGRPNDFFQRLRCFGKKNGITSIDGPLWHRNKTFLVQQLRNLGFGKECMENQIGDELNDIVRMIERQSNTGEDVQVNCTLSGAVLNIIWAFVSGQRISRADPKLQRFVSIMQQRSKAFDMTGGTLNQYPWLRFIAPEWSGYNLLRRVNEQLRDFIMAPIEEHLKHWQEGREVEDVIYAYITAMKKSDDDSYSVDELLMICVDLFLGGAVVTSSALDYAFFLMAYHPDIQKKVHQELDDKLQRSSALKYADRQLLPYVEAVLMEVVRYASMPPILGPRRLLRDTIVNGYHIPKNTTVLLSAHSVSQDEKIWGDPRTFRPERFLSAEGKLVNSEHVITYGLGKRRCVAEPLARCCVFMFFAGIMREFRITADPQSFPDNDNPVPGLAQAAPPYKAMFIKR